MCFLRLTRIKNIDSGCSQSFLTCLEIFIPFPSPLITCFVLYYLKRKRILSSRKQVLSEIQVCKIIWVVSLKLNIEESAGLMAGQHTTLRCPVLWDVRRLWGMSGGKWGGMERRRQRSILHSSTAMIWTRENFHGFISPCLHLVGTEDLVNGFKLILWNHC